jgi:predicted  nucleic acid-binding Zn-ribbon protein
LTEKRQAELITSLDENTRKLEEQISRLKGQRLKLTNMLPVSLVTRYDRQRELKQGIGAAALEGRICSSCHIELTEGQLSKARREADAAGVGVCPSCLRLLVL